MSTRASSFICVVVSLSVCCLNSILNSILIRLKNSDLRDDGGTDPSEIDVLISRMIGIEQEDLINWTSGFFRSVG